MTLVAHILFVLIYLTFAIPICLFVLLFWLIRLVITVGIMVFAMFLEAWRKKSISSRPMEIIDNVMRVGPDVVKLILAVPFRKSADEGTDRRSDFVFEFGYSALFLLAILCTMAFRGFVEAFGRAIEVPSAVFSEGGLAAKFGLAYVVGSIILAGYVVVKGELGEGPFRYAFLPVYLLVSGATLAFISYTSMLNLL